MGSMSYCRFQNTLGDLRDAEWALNETGGDLTRLSAEEHRAVVRLINLCIRLGEDWGEQHDQ